MSQPLFADRLADAVLATAPLCLGLDPHLERFPAPLRATFEGLTGASRRVIPHSSTTPLSLPATPCPLALSHPPRAGGARLGAAWLTGGGVCR